MELYFFSRLSFAFVFLRKRKLSAVSDELRPHQEAYAPNHENPCEFHWPCPFHDEIFHGKNAIGKRAGQFFRGNAYIGAVGSWNKRSIEHMFQTHRFMSSGTYALRLCEAPIRTFVLLEKQSGKNVCSIERLFYSECKVERTYVL